MIKELRVPPKKNIRLADYDPAYTSDIKSAEDAREDFKKLNMKMIDLQELMYAEKKHGLLIILQAMDAGGKDGTIKHVMRGINPQSCQVRSFKAPTDLERSHDFLWRYHIAVPPKGMVGIFNRSHYEDVLVTRVHKWVTDKEARRRFKKINQFEQLLIDNGIAVVKFYLHISKEEQKKRLEERLQNKEKHWKFSKNDVKERLLWDQYMEAFEDVLNHCSTVDAPWYIIPSNHKWFRNLAVAKILVKTMEALDMKTPAPEEGLESVVIPD